MPRIIVDNVGSIGLIKDLPAHRLPPEGWSDAAAMRFNAGGAEQVQTERVVLGARTPSANVEDAIWLKQFPSTAAPLWMYAIPEDAGTDGEVWVADSATPTTVHSDLTRASGGYTTSLLERPQGFVHQGLGYWNNTVDQPQLWGPMTAATAMIDLTNWSTNDDYSANTRAKFMRSYKNFIVMGHVSNSAGAGDHPYRIAWSDPAPPGVVPTTWSISDTTALTGEIDLADTPDYVLDGLAYGDVFILYKERTTWGMQFVGGGDVMRFWIIFPDSGLLTRDCVISFPLGHVVVTQDDMIVHQGQFGSQISILHNKLRRWVFNNLDTTYYYNSFLCLNHPKKEVWFFFPSGIDLVANPNGWANKVVIWNWIENTAGLRDLPAAGVPFGSPGPIVGSDEPLTWT